MKIFVRKNILVASLLFNNKFVINDLTFGTSINSVDVQINRKLKIMKEVKK